MTVAARDGRKQKYKHKRERARALWNSLSPHTSFWCKIQSKILNSAKLLRYNKITSFQCSGRLRCHQTARTNCDKFQTVSLSKTGHHKKSTHSLFGQVQLDVTPRKCCTMSCRVSASYSSIARHWNCSFCCIPLSVPLISNK